MGACAGTVFLVRHADIAAGGGNDPVLSAAGTARAQALRAMLADAGIGAIFTTSLRRSKLTAEPLATTLGITPSIVNDTDEVVATLRGLPTTAALVVGHSNTVPAIIAGLGGPVIPNLGEAEFNNLFVQSGPCLSRLRYGA